MDVNNIRSHFGASGRSKGRGKDKGKFGKSVPKFAGTCNLCGKMCHKKDERWFKDAKTHKGKDTKGKSKGKDGKTSQQQQQFRANVRIAASGVTRKLTAALLVPWVAARLTPRSRCLWLGRRRSKLELPLGRSRQNLTG